MRSGDLPDVTDQTRDFARKLRREMTISERRLWALLRNKRLGVKFRRQEPIVQFIVDFCCKDAMLIIELDGGQHYEEGKLSKDETRTRELEILGFKVIRFSGRDVLMNSEAVANEMLRKLEPEKGTPPLTPPPQARGVED